MSTPSVEGLNLTKAELVDLADRMRDKAQAAHAEARQWQNRATAAEKRLALYDAREQGTNQ